MKKLSVVLAVTAMAAAVLSGCGKKEADMRYLKDFDASKYVELGQYKGLEVSVEKNEVTDEEVNQYIDYILMYYTEPKEITDRTDVRTGDIANIDYVGTLDGVAFEGGTAEGYDLTIGSGSFIDGFEDGLIGVNVGETVDLNLTFPEQYQSAELAGKDVVFKVTVNKIQEEVEPTLNDETVKTIDPSLNSVDEFKAQVKDTLIQQAEETRADDIFMQIQEQLFTDSTFKDAPSGFSDRIFDTLMESIRESAEQYQTDESQIASYFYGVSAENYEAELKDYCNNELVPQYLLMGAIAKAEGIEISDADMDESMKKELEEASSTYSLDEYKELIGDLESYREYMLVEQVSDLLVENAVVNETESTGEENQ